jgi:hypothetical protein
VGRLARFWDERVEAGETWQRTLIGPAVERGITRKHSVHVSSYIRPSEGFGVAVEGQPGIQRYFHRPISLLFDA